MELVTATTMVVPTTSSRVGKETFLISERVSVRNSFALLNQSCISRPDLDSIQRLAGQEGFEPPTLGFGDRCSTSSSYWPVFLPLLLPHSDLTSLLDDVRDRSGADGAAALADGEPDALL